MSAKQLTTVDIFTALSEKSTSDECIFNKDFIVVMYKDFEPYLPYFSQSIKIGSALNYRSRKAYKHIHAVRRGDTVQLHIDYGNPYIFPPLVIVHFFYDVVPYFLWHLIKLKVPYKF